MDEHLAKRRSGVPWGIRPMFGFGLAMAVLLAAGILQYKIIGVLIQTEALVGHTHEVLTELEGSYSGLQQAESGTRGYLATGVEDYVAMFHDGIGRADKHLRNARTLTADNLSQQENFERLGVVVAAKRRVMENLVALRHDQGFAAASEELRKGEGLRLMREIRALIDAMEEKEDGLLVIRQAASRSKARRAWLAILFGTILALCLTLATSWLARRDAIRRRQAEERVGKALLYSRSLIEASLDPLVTISREGKITDVNQATELVTGVARQQLVGSDFSTYFTEPALARKGYEHVFSEGSVRDYPLAIRHASGRITEVLYNASVFKDDAGRVEGVFAAARDITERKQVEEQLRKASLYSRSLLEASLDPLVTINRDGKITDVNQATEFVTGVARQQLIGSDFSTYFTGPGEARKGYEQVFAQGAVRDYPLAIRHASGSITEVLYNATLFKDEAGRVEGVFAAARDITERKRAEEELARKVEELARSNAELQQFAYVASHDLQEPLRMVASFTQLLAERYKGKLGADADEFIGFAVDGARRMQSLVNDLLAYSRVGTRGKEFAAVDCEQVLQTVLANLQITLEESGGEVTCDPLPTVKGDETQLGQVLQNLVGNALKFHDSKAPRVHVSAQEIQGQWRFSVRDNGIGIDPKQADRIFLLFQRLHTREEYPGTGMGLAITKKIVERHGGRIWVESAPGNGSTFYFNLPMKGVIHESELKSDTTH